MKIHQLEYFVAVAETLNFTKAANRFYISQTAVTQQIKTLEQELGIPLFLRSKRHVKLTPAGRVFLTDIQDILRNLQSAVERCTAVSTGVTGTLRCGIVKDFIDVGFVDIVDKFCQEYPNVEIFFVRHTVGILYEQLINGKVDVIVNVKFHTEKYPAIRYKVLQQAALLAIVPAGHHLAKRQQVAITDLQTERLLLLDTQGNEFDEKSVMLQNVSTAGKIPPAVMYISDVETIFLMVATNRGIGLVPSYVPNLSQLSDKVRAVPVIGNEHQVEVIIVWDTGNINPALARFTEMLRSNG